MGFDNEVNGHLHTSHSLRPYALTLEFASIRPYDAQICFHTPLRSDLLPYIRGGALEKRFGGMNADAIFKKLKWAKAPLKKKDPTGETRKKRVGIVHELLEAEREKKKRKKEGLERL